MAPVAVAYAPSTQAMPTAPAIGRAKTKPPNTMDRTPLSIKSHSPVSTRRRQIAAAISKTPITTAHAAMNHPRANAGIPGQKNVNTPAAMPTSLQR